MTLHFQKQIEHLKNSLLGLCTVVEENVFHSIQSIEDLNESMAYGVLDRDISIDELSSQIEEECLKILALYQPVASDLRYVIAALKINMDLERIGNLAVNNAKRVPRILQYTHDNHWVDFRPLGEMVQSQFRKALDSFVHLDVDLADQVRQGEPLVDLKNKELKALVASRLREETEFVDLMLLNDTVVKNLERMADHANHIAESVLYLVYGRMKSAISEDD